VELIDDLARRQCDDSRVAALAADPRDRGLQLAHASLQRLHPVVALERPAKRPHLARGRCVPVAGPACAIALARREIALIRETLARLVQSRELARERRDSHVLPHRVVWPCAFRG
jgi:hypothetical protein